MAGQSTNSFAPLIPDRSFPFRSLHALIALEKLENRTDAEDPSATTSTCATSPYRLNTFRTSSSVNWYWKVSPSTFTLSNGTCHRSGLFANVLPDQPIPGGHTAADNPGVCSADPGTLPGMVLPVACMDMDACCSPQSETPLPMACIASKGPRPGEGETRLMEPLHGFTVELEFTVPGAASGLSELDPGMLVAPVPPSCIHKVFRDGARPSAGPAP